MPHADFVHLRVHSAFSLSQGAIRTKDLVKLCAKHRMPAVAVTDSGNLFGALEFSLAARDAGVQPVIGCQLGIRREDGRTHQGAAPLPDQLVVLAQTAEGYANLLKLVSRSYLATESNEAPQISLADLTSRSDGLIALTGGPAGPVGRLLAEGQPAAAEAMLVRLAVRFKDRLYV